MIIGYSGSGIVPIATDLGAGEKERGTLEPLLSTSISRSSILIGKLIVTATFGSITSILSAVGLLLAFKFGMSDTMGHHYRFITSKHAVNRIISSIICNLYFCSDVISFNICSFFKRS